MKTLKNEIGRFAVRGDGVEVVIAKSAVASGYSYVVAATSRGGVIDIAWSGCDVEVALADFSSFTARHCPRSPIVAEDARRALERAV